MKIKFPREQKVLKLDLFTKLQSAVLSIEVFKEKVGQEMLSITSVTSRTYGFKFNSFTQNQSTFGQINVLIERVDVNLLTNFNKINLRAIVSFILTSDVMQLGDCIIFRSGTPYRT